MITVDTNMITEVKVVKDAVFSSSKGFKRWSLFGAKLFERKYDEKIGDVKFCEEGDTVTSEVGFNKKPKK